MAFDLTDFCSKKAYLDSMFSNGSDRGNVLVVEATLSSSSGTYTLALNETFANMLGAYLDGYVIKVRVLSVREADEDSNTDPEFSASFGEVFEMDGYVDSSTDKFIIKATFPVSGEMEVFTKTLTDPDSKPALTYTEEESPTV